MDIHWLLKQSTDTGKTKPVSYVLRAGDQLTASVLEVAKGNDALLAIGQFNAYARLPLPVVTGQNIQIRVEAANQGLRMRMLPKSGSAENVASDQKLEIRLFEPVSDKPVLAAHSRSLVPGQSLQGRITGFEKDGLMLVDFGKFKAFAKIDIPVRPGQTLPLTVVKTDNGIAFSVASTAGPFGSKRLVPTIASGAAGETGTAAGTPGAPSGASPPQNHATPTPAAPPTTADMAALRDHIQQLVSRLDQPQQGPSSSSSNPSQAVLTNLQKALEPASPLGDTITLVNRVRDFVINSGIYFEKRLAETINTLQARSTAITPAELAEHPAIRDLMVKDLKPNLLILNQLLNAQTLDSQGVDRHMLETLKSVVQRAVSHIEQQQFSATEKPADPDLLQAFSHLLFLTDTQHNARLKVYYPKKGQDEDHKKPRVSLLLDMDRMGVVRADLWMAGTDLNVTFFVKEAPIKAAIEVEHYRIAEMLKDTFNTVAVSVVVSEKKIAEFDGEDLTLPNRLQVDVSI